MDIRTIESIPQAAVSQFKNSGSVKIFNTDGKGIESMEAVKGLENEIPEKVMMDLKDVQNFLYMLIGSDIKVESGRDQIGNSVNTVA